MRTSSNLETITVWVGTEAFLRISWRLLRSSSATGLLEPNFVPLSPLARGPLNKIFSCSEWGLARTSDVRVLPQIAPQVPSLRMFDGYGPSTRPMPTMSLLDNVRYGCANRPSTSFQVPPPDDMCPPRFQWQLSRAVCEHSSTPPVSSLCNQIPPSTLDFLPYPRQLTIG